MDWNVIASVAAAASAVFAGWQILQTRGEACLRATFDHLRDIEHRVQEVRHVPPSELCAKTRDAYRGVVAWDQDCKAYMTLLDGLELLAMARRLKMVDARIVDEFLAPVVRRDLVSLSAIADFRSACEEPNIYRDLGDLLVLYEGNRAASTRQPTESS